VRHLSAWGDSGKGKRGTGNTIDSGKKDSSRGLPLGTDLLAAGAAGKRGQGHKLLTYDPTGVFATAFYSMRTQDRTARRFGPYHGAAVGVKHNQAAKTIFDVVEIKPKKTLDTAFCA
jgi:hypothetical protein